MDTQIVPDRPTDIYRIANEMGTELLPKPKVVIATKDLNPVVMAQKALFEHLPKLAT